MGDRANIRVRQGIDDCGVYLYTHWDGTDLPDKLRVALAKQWRWDDAPYLTRIIFDVMTHESHGNETGYGISAFPTDGRDRVLEVNCNAQQVWREGGKSWWTFQEYACLSPREIRGVWEKDEEE